MKRDRLICGLIAVYCFVALSWIVQPGLLMHRYAHATAIESTKPVEFSVLPDAPDPNEVFRLINRTRQQHGLPPLTANEQLGKLALQRAEDMAKRQYYAHKDPDGKYYYDYFPSYQLHPDYSCENLDLVFVPQADMFIKEWMASAKHQACLMNQRTTQVGVAVTKMMLIQYDGSQVPVYVVVGIHATDSE